MATEYILQKCFAIFRYLSYQMCLYGLYLRVEVKYKYLRMVYFCIGNAYRKYSSQQLHCHLDPHIYFIQKKPKEVERQTFIK